MNDSSRRVTAIIPAAGSGQRLGGGTPKALRLLHGRSILERAVLALDAHEAVVEIIVAAPAEVVARLRTSLPGTDADLSVVAGGPTRQASVAAALAASSPANRIVLVHDAARPLVPHSLIGRVIDAVAGGAPAVVPGLPVPDTIKRVDAREIVVDTPPRAELRAIQTPQGFQREVLLSAHARSGSGEAATDDAALVERTGSPVLVVPGDHAAMKITTPADLQRAAAYLEAEDPR